MRRYRMGLIQTAEQLRFSYQSIIEGADALGIDLRKTTPYEDSVNKAPSSDGSYDSDDESISEDESEEDVDITPPERPPHHHSNCSSNVEGSSLNDVDEPPPPIPPRAESLSSPGTLAVFNILISR